MVACFIKIEFAIRRSYFKKIYFKSQFFIDFLFNVKKHLVCCFICLFIIFMLNNNYMFKHLFIYCHIVQKKT
ncbi:MAG: hypothetical protein EAY66_05295 [Sphingobacteriales bacterium]|nr:MAG: hypothetical protein EAY66_05295 [Sphingobacteriales bacterium]